MKIKVCIRIYGLKENDLKEKEIMQDRLQSTYENAVIEYIL